MRGSVAGAIALVVLAAGLAGCFGERTSPVEVTPYLPLLDGAPGRTTQFALFLLSTDSFKQTLGVGIEGLPQGWRFAAHPSSVTIPGRGTLPLVVDVTPAGDARHGPHTLRVKVGDTGADIILNVEEQRARPVTRGGGVALEFVAWAANGTLLATNAARLVNQTDIPNATQAPPTALPRAANGTQPLLGYLGDAATMPDGFAEQGYVALPEAWVDALLQAGGGEGAREGDAVAAALPAEAGAGGALLRVIEVVPADTAS